MELGMCFLICDIAIKKEDLKLIPRMDARINEKIKAEFGD